MEMYKGCRLYCIFLALGSSVSRNAPLFNNALLNYWLDTCIRSDNIRLKAAAFEM